MRVGGLFLRYMASASAALSLYRVLSAGLEGNGYSVTVSAEEYLSVNERVPHHRVVSGVLRDAQT